MDRSQSQPGWIGSRILASFLATLAGWIAGGALFIALSLCEIMQTGSNQKVSEFEFELLLYAIVMGILLLGIWLILILPIFLFVPGQSLFWQPVRLSLTGIAIGLVIGTPYYLLEVMPTVLLQTVAYMGFLAVIGGVTGYAAAMLNRRSLSPSRHRLQNL